MLTISSFLFLTKIVTHSYFFPPSRHKFVSGETGHPAVPADVPHAAQPAWRPGKPTVYILHPRMLDDFDAKALVEWVCPCEVAVGENAAGVVATDELEFFPVAHGDIGVLLL